MSDESKDLLLENKGLLIQQNKNFNNKFILFGLSVFDSYLLSSSTFAPLHKWF